MTSRQRKNSSTNNSDASRFARKSTRKKRRQHLVELLESRQLLAGPQLIGIQPNEGDLITDGSVVNTAPRVLTLRFDEDQVLDPVTLDGIRVTRAGDDGVISTADDVRIVPGLISVGDPEENTVLVRFSETLPDDLYKVEVFGFDDDGLDITGLRNDVGELFQPEGAGQRVQTTLFDLQLGALIESVVPQPVVRLDDGSLVQNRNEIVVYFNEDPLFVEDDSASGTIRINNEEITVTGELVNRSFDDTEILFVQNTSVSNASAVHDPVERTITVTYPQFVSFRQIATAIDNLDNFSASVTGGSQNAAFIPPTATGARFTVKGNATARSAENPRFYQLFLTQDTVRTTDDALYNPDEVIYDPVTHTARLFFNFNADGSPIEDINDLGPDADGNSGVGVGGGTFRLRIGTAVDDRVDVILPPLQRTVAASAITDFGIADLSVTFFSKVAGEAASGRQVRFVDSGAGGLTAALDTDGTVVFDLGGDTPEIRELRIAAQSNAAVDAVLDLTWSLAGVQGAGGTLLVPGRVVGAPALTMSAVGETLGTALDVGTFGTGLTTLMFNESIDPQPLLIELPGGNDDPGHLEIPESAGNLLQHINDNFGPDSVDGITEIAYNFNGIFDQDAAGNSFLNQITERQKDRIREALGLWASEIGVQFFETADQGITFALGDTNDLQPRLGLFPVSQFSLGARVRIDPTFQESAIVFSSETDFQLAYGEDFLRKAMAGIGLILGLEQTPDLPAQVLMSLDPTFLNDTINPVDPLPSLIDPLTAQIPQFALRDLEPVFPGPVDVLHGNYLHRSDSIDVDLFRFEVDLNDADRVGTLTAETFAERLSNTSLLDTTLTLFEEVRASAVSDFGVGTTLEVAIGSKLEGLLGNNSRIDFIQTDRPNGDSTVRVSQAFDSAGQLVANAILVDLPRQSGSISSVPVGDVIDAINNHPFASSIFRVALTTGSATQDISGSSLNFSPILLSGGGLNQLSRNDDYFSEDSRIIASLDAGTYYVGVAASGNDQYDPTVPGSSYGGRTQGAYELHLKFEPQVDEVDVIRDEDNTRIDVPGTALDGDGDGTAGGVNNFWFQTRPLARTIEFTENGAAVTQGQTITIIGGGGVSRTYEFVPLNGTPRPGNVSVFYNPGNAGVATPPSSLASALQSAVNGRRGETGVSVTTNGAQVLFDGERSISVSSDFRGGIVHGRTIFVDKTAGPLADGSLERPFNNIANSAVANAFDATLPGDIVRIVGNGGSDQDITTEADNFSYQIGVSDTGGLTLEDGRTMEVPKGVTTMIDAGAAFKLRSARIGVGSSSVQDDRSGGALQILGTPRLVQLSLRGEPVKTTIKADDNTDTTGFDDGRVIFTSSRDRAVDAISAGNNPQAGEGNWGGLVFRRDIDQAEGRRDLEDEGIFLQHVNHADIRYGGSSNLFVDSVQQTVNPIQIINLRPTVSFNEIFFSADAAISAAPNSFRETSFQAPEFQLNGSFTADYSRVGPDIHNNVLFDNSINGLFVRSSTTPVDQAQRVITTVRFDDTSIVHAIAENLVVAGNPGGSITDGFAPNLSSTSGRELSGGRLQAADYEYRMTFVDIDGFESLSTDAVNAFGITVTSADSSVELIGLPIVGQSDYVARRIYRAQTNATNPVFELVATLDASSQSFIDDGSALGGVLDLSSTGARGRLDGSLVFDPGLVVKLQGSRIELGQGAQLLAEGTEQNPVVFTSTLDDRYGAGGTFDTNNDNLLTTPPAIPDRGDWSGIYASPTSRISIDNSIIAYSGGISLIEGESRGFAPIEIQQAEARIANTRFEFNQDGQDGSGAVGRAGRLGITPSTIFVRGSQPIILSNEFIDNRGAIIAIDSDSLIADYVLDVGRQTGDTDRRADLDDNHGPLIRDNRYENIPADDDGDKQISGLDIRGGVQLTASVWDDTDIVHVLSDSIVVGNLHSSGGLLLKSRPEESLVVKLSGAGTPNSPTLGTGFTATGTPGSTADRIGGTVHIVGLPGAPVVLTSFQDDTVGAGRAPDGSQFTDTNGDSFGSRPESNDWRSILLDQYSNDRNVDFILEQELSTAVPPGFNGTGANAQLLGELAASIDEGDDTRRIGFEVEGFLSGPTDVDFYSFVGSPGSEVWIDVDETLFQLDTVVELLDVNGNLVGRSDNSAAEISGDQNLFVSPTAQQNVGTLQSRADAFTEFGVNGAYRDINSTNPRDAGIRFTLPGTESSIDSRSVYFFRVRSASLNPEDAGGGLTKGGYKFQVRLQEDQEFPGSVVRYADIRYANHGIHVRGLPGESPLLGDAQENENIDSFGFGLSTFQLNDQIEVSAGSFTDTTAPGIRPQNLGNLVGNKNNVISVGGSLDFSSDVDFYQVDLDFGFGTDLYQSTVFDIDYADGSRPDTNLSIFYDPDGEFGPAAPRLVLFGQEANIAEDRTSPLGEDDALERLLRGSSGSGDAFVGPVSLPQGSYYVAVTEAGSVPTELTDNPLVRREPINSVQRIVEDRVEVAPPSTASGPLIADFFSDAAITASGFTPTGARGTQAGHGIQQNFDGSNAGTSSQETIFSEGFVPLPFDVGGSPLIAFDVDSLDFSIADNNEIGGAFGGGFFGTGTSENTSTVIPHVTIDGSLAFDAADFYQVIVPEDGTRVIIDVDRGFNPFEGEDDNDDLTPIFLPDITSIDSDLVLLQSTATGLAFATPRIDDSDPNDGRSGSAPIDLDFDGVADLPLTSLDPFFDGVLDAGLYFIGIVAENTTVTLNNGGVQVANDNLPTQGEYRLHISVEDHALPVSASGNQSLFIADTPGNNGQLVAEPFDLTGYSAEDQPNFYFNYLLDGFGAAVSYTITSTEDPTGLTGFDFIGDTEWHQNIVSLAQFAGHTNIQVTFDYTAGTISTGEGLYLDDFIVGFAERGETVFNARGDEDGFTFGFGNTGEYQLEVRTATDFAVANPSFFGSTQTLVRDFDTNDRHDQVITIIAPEGSQITDGDTFTISDGAATQRFEFDDNNQTNFSNLRINFADTDTSAEIAEKIRAAINQSSQLNVEAASASGVDVGAMTDNRLNLFGAVSGSFLVIDAPSDAPTTALQADSNGDALIPAILFDGSGDTNYHRVQSAVIIENNVISDARAIGIWSEPGDRDIDPEDLRALPDGSFFFGGGFGFGFNNSIFDEGPITDVHPYLQQPPVGNSYPGAVRNLPTLNDSVIGGIAPGVVVRNNTIDQAGLAGVKVEGEVRPWVIYGMDGLNFDPDASPVIDDGVAFAIDAGGTRVVFEFEDISGAPIPDGGSGQIGGDGFVDGHVPVYYRRADGTNYNNLPNTERGYGHSNFELMLSIVQSIQGSILVTNGLAELVTPYIGPSLFSRDEFAEQNARTPESFPTAAVYLEGVSNIYFTSVYSKGGSVPLFAEQAPVFDSVQPSARVVNNTIYGADGTESEFVGDPTLESNDLISESVITHVGRAHSGAFIADAAIGDVSPGLVAPQGDVDFYQVELVVGDRLIVDIDTPGNNLDTSVRVFNEFGVAQVLDVVNGFEFTVSEDGDAPSHLDPESTAANPVTDNGNGIDPFVDFTALESGTFYVAVSSAGNDNYDPNSLSGRTNGVGGVGDYQIGLNVFAPRSFVLSLDDGNENQITNNLGTKAGDVVGATFTVSQIPDFPTGVLDALSGPSAATNGNQLTFEFSNAANTLILPNGNINVALITADIDDGYRVPDIMQAISRTVAGLQILAEQVDIPMLGNHENGNGPDGRSGPISRGRAFALGGIDGDNLGIRNLSARPEGDSFFLFPTHYLGPIDSDFPFGFGHDRTETGNVSLVPANTLTDGFGTTELYVLFENIANIELSPEAIAAGFKLTPDQAKPEFADNADQLITEHGIWVTSGSSPTLLNNVISNVHQSVVVEESTFTGFGKRVEVFGDQFVKPQDVVLVGSVFQHDEERNSEIRFDLTWPVDFEAPFDVFDTSLSTDHVIGATNVADQSDDFNFVVAADEPSLFVDAAGNNFLPADGSILIDSAINSVDDRDEAVTLKDAVGLPASNVLAPNRDVIGVLRVDNENFATPGAIGFSVFKDRGSNELADFVGPVATAEVPLDNDAGGIDTDPSTSFLNLASGTYEEFRIQIRDTGDESDPFAGFGVDDRTLVVSEIPGLRPSGANVTLFENERLLEEGIDYSFNYDETKNIITLTPLAGIWENSRSYRIELNNQDRNVLVAPDPTLINDGDQVSITDSNGGTLVFEFEAGYSLLVPEPITLVVPEVGTNAGGLSDGDIFQINDNQNSIVVFEFNQDTATLPGSVPIQLPTRQTPTVEEDLQVFLAEIANNIADAIRSEVDADRLDVDVRVIGNRVVVGAEPGTTAQTTGSGLQQLPRTLALRVPDAGVGPGGIVDADSFVVDNGSQSVTFEFDTNGNLNTNTNTIVPVAGLTSVEIANAIRDAVDNAGLGLNPSVSADGFSVFLNLPLNGTASVPRGQLTLVGLSRTPIDGDTLVITPTDTSAQITLEINRTDEPDPTTGLPMDDGVTDPNVPINLTRATTANELAGLVSNAIQSLPPIAGVSPNDLQVIDGGLLTIGGQEGLGLAVTGTSLEVTGAPSVTGASTIQVFGPLLLNLPLVGGGGIRDGSVLVLTDDNGNDVIFEFDRNLSPAPTIPTSIPVAYDSFSTVDVIAQNLVTAINAANIGINAQDLGIGTISLGRIDQARVNINGIPSPDPLDPTLAISGLAPEAILRRGIVSDGEVLSIRQGLTTVSFEFETAVGGGGVGPNNIAVPFQPGSSVGDVAASLAAAINNNRGNLRISAVAELDVNGDPTGQVLLDDQPGTIIDVTQAPTLNVTGVPGGATPIRISPAFSANEVKLSLINAINAVNTPGELPVTTLSAEDRGGSTFFVSNAQIFNGPIANFSLPAIADLAGNPLEANRDDLSTQFTILMPTVGLDFGDAPDPVLSVPGRYPTTNANNGPRHVVSDDLFLGALVDADVDGVPGTNADGDDLLLEILSEGQLFTTSLGGGEGVITIQTGTVNPLDRDGDTIIIDTGVATATLEFDIDGRFDEDNFAIRPTDPTSSTSIGQAILAAIEESPIRPASVSTTSATVTINADDEDGVIFTSPTNPAGILNRGVATPIEVSVTGAGVLEAWIDFNADGDWDDPGEQIIPMPENDIFDARRSEICPTNLTGVANNVFADTGEVSVRSFCVIVPPTTPIPPEAVQTYARFRVSREGNLGPEGLALSGEVEDYALTLLPGTPPIISQPNRTFIAEEDQALQALDLNGVLTPTTNNDDGLLAGVTDAQGDAVRIFSEDVGVRQLMTPAGTLAGELDLAADGTFVFVPALNFNGVVNFTARVTDVQPLLQSNELVSPRPISVTINVVPVNDAPTATVSDVSVTRTIDEDVIQVFSAVDTTDPTGGQDLIGSKYVPGPAGESDQPLIIQAAGSVRGNALSTLGGNVSISDDGLSVVYTPPIDFNGPGSDTFTYIVADIPGAGQVSEEAAQRGTVTINFRPVNDPPRTTNDNYDAEEGQTLQFPILGSGGVPGILDNDFAGPQDEVNPPQSQTIQLAPNQFPVTTDQGGTVHMINNNTLEYTPTPLFSGVDVFRYRVVDNFGAESIGTVLFNVGGVNNSPVFRGINGVTGVVSINRDESKSEDEIVTFDLNTWFSDPEDDDLTYTVTSNNPAVVSPEVNGGSLSLTFPRFGFGEATLTVTADDGITAPTSQPITVVVNDTPDPPSVIGTLNPLSGTEDQLVTANLSTVFNDPDAGALTYSVARIGNVVNPSDAQIALNDLVESIGFVGDQLQIQLKPNQSGVVDIEIAATDGSFRVSDTFTLTVSPVPDNPVATADGYNVPVGSSLQILNPADGLLRNDLDADGDSLSVDLASVTNPLLGTLEVNSNGTFVYTNQDGQVGQTDSFSYRVVDATGRPSGVVNVTLTLNQSRYQNPLTDLSEDVNADGQVSAIDALRVINFLNRELINDTSISVPVNQIGAPPPDYYDANGDGRVSASDALMVINQLRRARIGEGEFIGVGANMEAAAGVTSSFAAPSTSSLPVRNIELVENDEPTAQVELSEINSRDLLLTSGFEISAAAAEQAVNAVSSEESKQSSSESVDEALAFVLDEFTLNDELD